MATSISACRVDSEFRAAVPVHDWQELADLEKSVEAFGYLAPLIVWRNSAGECLVLDGHARLEVHSAASVAADDRPGAALNLAALPPQIVEIELPSRDAALLWIIDNQTARRNLTDLQRIELAAKREEIVRRMAKSNLKTPTGGLTSALLPKSLPPIDTRRECAKAAGVSEKTYDAGKLVIAAVAEGKLSPTVMADINAGTKSIHGVAKSLKTGGKPASKSKTSGWQKLVSVFTKAVRCVIKRDPNRSAEIAVELRTLADEFEGVSKVAA